MYCQECGSHEVKKLYLDPKDPPLNYTPCLCSSCYISEAVCLIDDLEDKIKDLTSTIQEIENDT